MIRSKEQVVYFTDSRTGQVLSDIIYFDAPIYKRNEINGTIEYNVSVLKFVPNEEITPQMAERSLFRQADNGILIQIMEIPATYKISTFDKIMTGITFDEYESKKNELMIEQIGRNSINYFGLTADKLTEV